MHLNPDNTFFKTVGIPYVLIYLIMPIVSILTSLILTTYFYMTVVVSLVLYILIIDHPKKFNTRLSFLFPFVFYGLLTFFYTESNTLLWGYQTLLFLLPVVLGYYLTYQNDELPDYYPKLIVVAIITTIITTSIGCIRFPSAARELATSAAVEKGLVTTYSLRNIGGYEFVYYLVLLYPIVILAYKRKKINTLFTAVITIAMLITIILTEYTIALLMFIITSIFFLFRKNSKFESLVVFAIVLLMLFFAFSDIIPRFLNWLSDIIQSDVISPRLKALAGGGEAMNQFEDNRVNQYLVSWKQFLLHPVWGNLFETYKINGGHSFILDSLASYGLIGGLLLIFMYVRIFKRFFAPFKNRDGYSFVIWAFLQTAILSLLNTNMWLEVLCLFLPILLKSIYKDEAYRYIDFNYETPYVTENTF